ncbi:MAG: hypothetical protein KDD48_04355 [Bdellovibrionales bacterium]|nr:hypothetical protein [Bdellovibrionales bacterium]
MNTQNDKPISLRWRDKDGSGETDAGVAFYEDNFNEYRLKVDMFPQSRRFYVKPVSVENGNVNYRVEMIDRKQNGKRKTVGTGSPTFTGSIRMSIPPYSQVLVLKNAQ